MQGDLDIDYEPIPDDKTDPPLRLGCEVCGFICCVCAIKAAHQPDCKFRKAATCAVGIECDHGRDVCAICDPCTCADRSPSPTEGDADLCDDCGSALGPGEGGEPNRCDACNVTRREIDRPVTDPTDGGGNG
jgi:hypothetical protein